MRRLGRLTGILLAVSLLLAVGLMLLLQTEWFKHQAADYISDRLGRQVVFDGPQSIDWSLQPLLRLEDVRLANAPWAEPETMAQAEAIELRIDLWDLLRGQVRLPMLHVEAPQAHLVRAADGRANWDFLTGPEAAQDSDTTAGGPEIDEIVVEEGRIDYRNAEHRIAVEVLAEAQVNAASAHVDLAGSGHVADVPLTLNLTTRTPEPAAPLAVEGVLEIREHHAELSGVMQDPMRPQSLDLALTIAGPDPQALAAQMDLPLPELGDYELSLQVLHEDGAWVLRDISGRVGERRFEGSVRLYPDERFAVAVDLAVDQLDLDALDLFAGEQEESEDTDAALAVAVREALDPLRRFDGDLDLRVGELKVFDITAHELEITATLEQGALEVAPLAAQLAGGGITITSHLNVGEQAVEGTLTADITDALHADSVMLLPGRLQLRLTPEHLLADDTELHIRDDSRNLAFRLEAATADPDQAIPRTQVRTVGVRDGQDFVADFLAGPLLQLTELTETPPLDAELRTGDAVVAVHGELEQLLKERTVDARVSAEGPNLDALGTLFGVDMPAVPPFEVQAHLLGEAGHWNLRDFDGQLGESDLAGTVDLFLAPGQPSRINADLQSEFLNIDDLTQDSAEEREAGLAELLQSLNGELRFRAGRIKTERIPMEEVFLQARVEGTRFEMQPLEFRLGGGSLSFAGYLDAGQVPMRGYLDADIEGIDLQRILPALGIRDQSGGVITGRADIEVTGHTYTDWIYSAVGEVRVLMTGGKVDTLLAELAGEETASDIMEYLLPEDAAILDLDCAHLAVNPNQGLLEVGNFFVTTPNLNILAEGTIDLNGQTIELSVGSESDDPSIAELLSPIELTGPWNDPDVDVLTANLITRALAAVTLGAALAPGAAAAAGVLAPLLPGLGDEPTPCHEIIDQALADIEEEDEGEN